MRRLDIYVRGLRNPIGIGIALDQMEIQIPITYMR
jgi:hypothetical protein